MVISAITQQSALALGAKRTSPRCPSATLRSSVPADLARLAAPAVNEQLLLEVPQLPSTADKVPHVVPPRSMGRGEHAFRSRSPASDTAPREIHPASRRGSIPAANSASVA